MEAKETQLTAEEIKSVTLDYHTNTATVTGVMVEPFTYSHQVRDINFYTGLLRTDRYSGIADLVPITISEERLGSLKQAEAGETISVLGRVRTFDKKSESRPKLFMSVLCKFAALADENTAHRNSVSLVGTICKTPIIRTTPLGKTICDVVLAVSELNTGSNYIPCIAWGPVAEQLSRLGEGDKISILGRWQSRAYEKEDAEGNIVTRVTHEISISHAREV